MQTTLEHRQVVSPIYMMAAKTAPDSLKLSHGHPISASFACKNNRIDRPRLGTADDRKRIRAPFGQQLGYGLEDTDLKRPACTAAGHHESCFNLM